MHKFIALAAIVQSIYGRWVLKRLMAAIVTIAIFTFITAMLASAVLIGGFYFVYHALVVSGVDPYWAKVMIAAFVALAALSCMIITIFLLHRLRHMPGKLLCKAPGIAKVSEALDAFCEGFLEVEVK